MLSAIIGRTPKSSTSQIQSDQTKKKEQITDEHKLTYLHVSSISRSRPDRYMSMLSAIIFKLFPFSYNAKKYNAQNIARQYSSQTNGNNTKVINGIFSMRQSSTAGVRQSRRSEINKIHEKTP